MKLLTFSLMSPPSILELLWFVIVINSLFIKCFKTKHNRIEKKFLQCKLETTCTLLSKTKIYKLLQILFCNYTKVLLLSESFERYKEVLVYDVLVYLSTYRLKLAVKTSICKRLITGKWARRIWCLLTKILYFLLHEECTVLWFS